jgi:hypothetical protein
MTLEEFVLDNRQELIRRTRAKVAKRSSPPRTEAEMEHGVPLFLSQLVSTLRAEGQKDFASRAMPDAPDNENIVRSAILHGQTLRRLGFTIEQVVHDYGDVCQAVTELAVESLATVTAAEFHTLNRCLDNAIAGAVTSWTQERDTAVAHGAERRDLCRNELLDLVDTASVSFSLLREGQVGHSGATARVIGQCFAEMRSLLANPKWGEAEGAGKDATVKREES